MSEDQISEQGPRIVNTDEGSINGQDKCPKCGATDISLNVNTGMLRCNFCRHEFAPQKIQGMETDISQLQGEVISSGAQDINQDAQNVITLKCTSCGAEVVIDTAESTQARCHWCRNTLSINQQIPNGAVPDVVLPFNVKKDDAKEKIEEFVGKRKFFAHPNFRQEFTTDNIMGVYFPYMVIDVNASAQFEGEGEREVRRYTRRHGDSETTYYDADLYKVGRKFDLTIEGLTVESNAERLDKNDKTQTNNIINSIMPFDTDNCVKYNSNYLKGYTSEKRNISVQDIKPLVNAQSKDIARFSANKTLKEYNRGVNWKTQNFEVKGSQWKTAYLPVWLYSYQQKKSNGDSVLHYVAVNARTKETMGSVPIHMPKLVLISCLIEILGIIAMVLATDFKYRWLFLIFGILFFASMFAKYRNTEARHHHEFETKSTMSNLTQYDKLVRRLTGLTNSRINGANNTAVNGDNSIFTKKIKAKFNGIETLTDINNNFK